MASEERFSNADDHREEQEILDDLKSIKDLLDDEAVASQEASGDHAEAEEPVRPLRCFGSSD